jgi:large subunit ribosomal protein L17e
MTIAKAKSYLNDVLAHKRCIPYTKYYGGIGRTGQASQFGKTAGRWP